MASDPLRSKLPASFSSIVPEMLLPAEGQSADGSVGKHAGVLAIEADDVGSCERGGRGGLCLKSADGIREDAIGASAILEEFASRGGRQDKAVDDLSGAAVENRLATSVLIDAVGAGDGFTQDLPTRCRLRCHGCRR